MARLRPLPYREVERKLRAAGSKIVRQKGRHVKFLRHDFAGVRTAIVPRRREVPIGTLQSILRQVGLDVDEFVRM
ncbi:MAG: type II toxin-antitoxin system HicA family toxin [bacterium]|nr:type II toxin-antitoxin system HicA family toxin [bacterium]MDE0289108.1 type II toxin-antitoxin system HicA family toxin [bacterium]MDE0440391.1 type II toxin-antitoxin system HicA family toxin [bacterium]